MAQSADWIKFYIVYKYKLFQIIDRTQHGHTPFKFHNFDIKNPYNKGQCCYPLIKFKRNYTDLNLPLGKIILVFMLIEKNNLPNLTFIETYLPAVHDEPRRKL